MRIATALLALSPFIGIHSQNIQLHYDLGHSLYSDLTPRQSVTTTVEMFKPDTWGSTYFFIDLDYKNDGVKGTYWEISREFNVSKNKQFAAHVEYNGGAETGETDDNYYGNRYQHTALPAVPGIGIRRIIARRSVCNCFGNTTFPITIVTYGLTIVYNSLRYGAQPSPMACVHLMAIAMCGTTRT